MHDTRQFNMAQRYLGSTSYNQYLKQLKLRQDFPRNVVQRNMCIAQATQNDDSLSSRYPHQRRNYLWAINMGIVMFCFAVMDGTLNLDMVCARLIIDIMQFKKIFSIHPRRTHELTLRSLIVLGSEREQLVVGVSHGRASHILTGWMGCLENMVHLGAHS